MVNPDQLFNLSQSIAVIGWAFLIFTPKWKYTSKLVTNLFIPSLLSVGYAIIIFTQLGSTSFDFDTLSSIRQLFKNDYMLLAGWIHYLVFDLFVGAWQLRDAQKRGISYWFVLPCLILTLFLGPIGLISYLTIKGIKSKVIYSEEQF